MMTSDFLCRQQTTVLRGMAAIIIAVFHVFIEWQLPRVVNVMGSICVALFLLLSGFEIHESYKTNALKDYWQYLSYLCPFSSGFSCSPAFSTWLASVPWKSIWFTYPWCHTLRKICCTSSFSL